MPPALFGALRSVVYRILSDDSHLSPMQRQQRRWNRLNDSRVMLATCYGATFAYAEDYAALDCHTMVMVGDRDMTTPPSGALTIYRALKHAHGPHLLPGMGHIIIVDAAELVAALLNKFLCKFAGEHFAR